MRRCDWLESRCSTSVCGVERRRRLVRAVGLDRREAPERLDQLLVLRHVLEVADEERAAARAGPLAPAEGEDRVAAERAQVLLRPEHGAAERVVAERGAVDQVLGDDRRLVVGARDLLDHDAALAVELLLVELRAPDEVGQQVDRLADHLGAAGDVERDEVVRRVGVEHRAHPLGRLVDLAVVVVLLAALEHEMLEEVGHPVLLRALGPRAGLEGHEHGHRAGAGQVDPVQGQPVREGGGVDLRHAQDGTCGRAIRLAGRGARGGANTLQVAHGCHRTSHPPPHRARAAAPARRRRPRPGRRDRLPLGLEEVPERRHGPGGRDVRDPPGRVRLPRRLHRLGQVDDHAPADQGDRAQLRLDRRRRPRPRRDHAQEDPVLPPQPRRRLPGLQAAAEPDGATTTSPTRCR